MTWTADFETTRDPPVRVWLWASCNINDESQVDIGYNINSFFEWMKGKDSIYIHNLKFDGHFLIYHLYKNMCWKYSQNSEPCTFCTVIGNMGQWYKISITYGDGETVHIFDSLKKLPMSIERMAKAFKLDIAKGSIDHTKIRDENYKPDENEEDYVKTDVKIPAQALALQFAKGLTKMTAGADALNKFKETIKDFREYFPVLNDAVDSDLRKSYKGGYVYVAEKYQGKTLGKGQVYDVNSMYPWAMRYKMLPYGKPIYFSGEYNQDDEYPLYIIKFIADFSLKKGYIPTVQIKNSPRFLGTEYIKNSDGLQELTMTNIDFEIFKRHYEINGIEFEYGYKFKGKTGIFNKYIGCSINAYVNALRCRQVVGTLLDGDVSITQA